MEVINLPVTPGDPFIRIDARNNLPQDFLAVGVPTSVLSGTCHNGDSLEGDRTTHVNSVPCLRWSSSAIFRGSLTLRSAELTTRVFEYAGIFLLGSRHSIDAIRLSSRLDSLDSVQGNQLCADSVATTYILISWTLPCGYPR